MNRNRNLNKRIECTVQRTAYVIDRRWTAKHQIFTFTRKQNYWVSAIHEKKKVHKREKQQRFFLFFCDFLFWGQVRTFIHKQYVRLIEAHKSRFRAQQSLRISTKMKKRTKKKLSVESGWLRRKITNIHICIYIGDSCIYKTIFYFQ